MEDCIIRDAGWLTKSGGSDNNADFKFAGRRPILRYNYIFDNRSTDVNKHETTIPGPLTAAEDNSVEFICIYNNTFDGNFNISYGNIGTVDVGTTDNLQKKIVYNNIYSNATRKAHAAWNPYSVFRTNHQRLSLQGYSDSWIGEEWAGNMIDIDTFTVRLHDGTATGAATVTGLANAKTEWSDTFLASNNANAPTYVNRAAKTKAGFALDTGSDGIGEAVPMTTVTAGSSGTTVTLGYAYWIFDGFDLGYFGIEGDYIAIYDSDGVSNERIRQVESVDSQTGITLTASVTVANGDKVWPVLRDGTTVVKNMGAAQ